MPEGPPRKHDDGSTDQGIAPYRTIDTRMRRRAGAVYLVMALAAGALVMASGVGLMWLTAVVPIAAIGVLHMLTAWRMPVSDMDAIERATLSFGFDYQLVTSGSWLGPTLAQFVAQRNAKIKKGKMG